MPDEAKSQPAIEGVAEAPVISFDEAPVFGMLPGVGRITLAAMVIDRGPDGKPIERFVAVAHLRGNGAALQALRNAIDGIGLMATGPAKPEGPAN